MARSARGIRPAVCGAREAAAGRSDPTRLTKPVLGLAEGKTRRFATLPSRGNAGREAPFPP